MAHPNPNFQLQIQIKCIKLPFALVTEARGLSQRLEGKYLFSFLLQLLCLHALLYLREQGCAGCVEVLETFLLAELLHLALQLPVGQPHLLELQLALVQLGKKSKETEKY